MIYKFELTNKKTSTLKSLQYLRQNQESYMKALIVDKNDQNLMTRKNISPTTVRRV